MNKASFFLIAVVAATATFFVIMDTSQHADLVIVNATVYTLDGQESVAGAIAIRGNRIIGVGTTSNIQNQFSSEKTFDAAGATVLPGFVDSHLHVLGFGRSLTELDLVGTTSPQQIAALVRARAGTLHRGEWVRGRGWDQNDWAGGNGGHPFPDASILDAAAPDIPVVLTRIDGHALWANTKAMELARIVKDRQRDLEGGTIVRRADGAPSGVFIDNAMSVINDVVPPYTRDEKKRMIERALNELCRYGLTTVHDMGIDEEEYSIYRELCDQRRLPLRVYALVGGAGPFWERMKNEGPFTDRVTGMFTLRAIKLYMDGALGSRGAALLEPYSDDPDNLGLLVSDPGEIERISEEAVQHGFQVCVHAIGDRANRLVLDAFANVEERLGTAAADARLRIEHAQVLSPDDLPRFRQLHVIPSMQPVHATSDMYWAEARLGPERIRGAYAWHSLLMDGNIIAAGSDAPVERPDPLAGFYAAITRQDLHGMPRTADDVSRMFQLSAAGMKNRNEFNGGWYRSQVMTRNEALRAYTTWGAYAGFSERQSGSIETGKRADIVILSGNIMTAEPETIPAISVVATIVDGKIRYQRSSAP